MEPFEPLSKYEEFPTYATIADATAAGLVVKPWVDGPPKYWRDPNPIPAFELDGIPMVVYPRAFFGKKLTPEQWGITEPLVLSVKEAGEANIPPTGLGMTNVKGADRPPRPVPLKPLGERQRIMRPSPFAGFQVRNLDAPINAPVAGEFTADEKALLLTAARKILE